MAKSAHVIVVGNEKGGSGKSTTAFHLAVYLLYQGHRVATVDADSRQQTFTRYVRNRRHWSDEAARAIPQPKHVHMPTAWGDSATENRKSELNIFLRAMDELQQTADFVVIDTPGFDSNLTRLAHAAADTLVTPINDSLIDLDVLARLDPATGEPMETSPYSRQVLKARAEQMRQRGRGFDWVLVRNRISNLGSRNAQTVQDTIDRLAERFSCRVAQGIAERVIFRSLFATGMTVFDPLEADFLGGTPSMSHINARQEYRSLVGALQLPRADVPMLMSA